MSLRIPENIGRSHVLKAIEQIDREGIPAKRNSTRYSLRFNGKLYPPKVVLSYANRWANGKELPSSDFYGGAPSNKFLKSLGFEIVSIPTK